MTAWSMMTALVRLGSVLWHCVLHAWGGVARVCVARMCGTCKVLQGGRVGRGGASDTALGRLSVLWTHAWGGACVLHAWGLGGCSVCVCVWYTREGWRAGVARALTQ
jgi:hypothetical protein